MFIAAATAQSASRPRDERSSVVLESDNDLGELALDENGSRRSELSSIEPNRRDNSWSTSELKSGEILDVYAAARSLPLRTSRESAPF